MLKVPVPKGAGFAIASYVMYAIGRSATLELLIFLSIVLVYSPIPGIYSLLEASRSKGFKKGFAVGIVALGLFDLLIEIDSLLRGDSPFGLGFPIGFPLLIFLPTLAGSVFLSALSGVLWSGTANPNIILHITNPVFSRVLSILLFLAAMVLWFVGFLVPLWNGLGR